MEGRRARRGDPGIYEPRPDEFVRVLGQRGAKFRFIAFAEDKGGEFAIVNGPNGQRYLTLDRIRPAASRR